MIPQWISKIILLQDGEMFFVEVLQEHLCWAALGGCWGYLGLAAGFCDQNPSTSEITILISGVLKQGLSLDKFAFFNL